MNSKLINIAKKAVITIILAFSVFVPIFAAEFPTAPHEYAEFAKVWDYVAANDVDVIELHYNEKPDLDLFGKYKYKLQIMSEKYRYVHPEDFNYLRLSDYSFIYSDDCEGFTLHLEFDDLCEMVKREFRTKAYEKAQEFYNEISSELSSEMTQKKRVKVFCEAIEEKVTYLNDGTDFCHTAYSALVHGYAVCDGYTSVLNMLLRLDGIECEGRLGDAGGLHEWTYAKLDGEWMNVDATWFDSDDESPNTKYAGLTDAEISVTHKADLTYKNLAENKILLVPAIVYYQEQYINDPPIMNEKD